MCKSQGCQRRCPASGGKTAGERGSQTLIREKSSEITGKASSRRIGKESTRGSALQGKRQKKKGGGRGEKKEDMKVQGRVSHPNIHMSKKRGGTREGPPSYREAKRLFNQEKRRSEGEVCGGTEKETGPRFLRKETAEAG